MQAAQSNQEPWLLLSSKQTNYVGTVRVARDADGKPVYDPETGTPVRERVPARAAGAAERYETVVRSDGHVISMVLTNAAAQVDGDTNFKKYQRAKQRHFGWFPITQCPVNLLNTGELNEFQIRDKSLLTAQPCRGKHTEQNPCPHAIAERDARRKAHAAGEANRMKAYQAEAEKILGRQAEMNRELVHDVAVAVATAITTNTPLVEPAPAPVVSGGPPQKKSSGKATSE